MARERITLKFWQSGDQSKAAAERSTKMLSFVGALDIFYDAIEAKITALLDYLLALPVLTAPMGIVRIVGASDGVTQVEGESDAIYRRRVAYQRELIKLAGSVAGVRKVWELLDLGDLVLEDRPVGLPFDMIVISYDSTKVSSALLDELLTIFGRACRRYAYGDAEASENTLYLAPLALGTQIDEHHATYQ